MDTNKQGVYDILGLVKCGEINGWNFLVVYDNLYGDMSKTHNSTVVICLGGSLIAPKEGIDVKFLKAFKNTLRPYLRKGIRFVVICGGGAPAREYQKAVGTVSGVGEEVIDRIGIKITEVNALLVRALFNEYAPTKIITNPHSAKRYTEQVLVAAGWKPGCSTDNDAILMAKVLGAKDVCTLSNIDWVYDKDPKEHDDARKIEDITWEAFRRDIVPDDWKPGFKSPFDPVAARTAQKHNIRVSMMNGAKLKNFERYLSGDGFKGTQIHN